jgi:hypothetical protein
MKRALLQHFAQTAVRRPRFALGEEQISRVIGLTTFARRVPSASFTSSTATNTSLSDSVVVTLETKKEEKDAVTWSTVRASRKETPSCGTGASETEADHDHIDDDEDEDDEMEQEDMFVEPHGDFAFRTREWGGPRRGGRFLEPTRFGDWERKGRCSDF